MPKSTPKIVAHVLETGKSGNRIVHEGISYSVRAYQLLVVGQALTSFADNLKKT